MSRIALVVLALMAVIKVIDLWVELRITHTMRREQRDAARTRHPAGKFCPGCRVVVADWTTHVRLAHGPRAEAPEDSW